MFKNIIVRLIDCNVGRYPSTQVIKSGAQMSNICAIKYSMKRKCGKAYCKFGVKMACEAPIIPVKIQSHICGNFSLRS